MVIIMSGVIKTITIRMMIITEVITTLTVPANMLIMLSACE